MKGDVCDGGAMEGKWETETDDVTRGSRTNTRELFPA